jgi:ABC-type phosphonate transport system ATPase subunit
VIGYESGTDRLVVMDPLTGGQDTISESEVLDLYKIVITGNK